MKPTTPPPLVSFLIATHDRPGILRDTVEHVIQCGLPRSDMEILVVENAARRDSWPLWPNLPVRVIRLRRNLGSCAKNIALRAARGRYVVFLDDDSWPRPGTIGRMMERFRQDDHLGSAGFRVHLPDGRQDASAFPDVFVGCGVGFRAEALREVGGLDQSYFMQAEELDLTFRLAIAGWGVGVFDDLHAEHLKSTLARRSDRTLYYDVRNNLRVIAAFLPEPFRSIYRADWIQRYRWLAETAGFERSFHRGRLSGTVRGWMDRRGRRSRLTPALIEHFFCWRFVERKMWELAETGVRRIVLIDWSKNVYPFIRGADLAGIKVETIADDRFAAPRREYRGVPIMSIDDSLARRPDVVIVTQTAAPHAEAALHRVSACFDGDIKAWFARLPHDRDTGTWHGTHHLKDGRLTGSIHGRPSGVPLREAGQVPDRKGESPRFELKETSSVARRGSEEMTGGVPCMAASPGSQNQDVHASRCVPDLGLIRS